MAPDPLEEPAKKWELKALRDEFLTKFKIIQDKQDKEDKSRAWFYRAVVVAFLTALVQVIVYIIAAIAKGKHSAP